MEEGKANWLMQDKLDHLRQAHAQKIVNGQSVSSQSKVKAESQGIPCKFFQSGKCLNKNDHTTNGQLHHHICSFCHGLGKNLPTHLKIVVTSVKNLKMTKALQYCSAY